MAIIANYTAFEGVHWETGTVRNVLAAQGVKAPHTGQHTSEALLLGISGGIAAGYFTFEYTGFDPWLHFLTRNTFDPMETLLERLKIKAEVKQTENAEKAVANVLGALEQNKPAIVWGDLCHYPYFNLPPSDEQWMMMPVVVYGYEGDTVSIADRAAVGLTVTTDEFAQARARTKSNKHRSMTLSAPDWDVLSDAVEAGIRACVANFLDEPSLAQLRGKFGLAAFTRWADLLADTKTKHGWLKAYVPDVKLYSVLRSAFHYIHFWGTNGSGSRATYADFLDEAALILNKPAIKDVASQYRSLAGVWNTMTHALLPDVVAPFKETRTLMQSDYALFVEQGGASLAERQQISVRLKAIRDEIAASSPLTDTQRADLLAGLREWVLRVREAEQVAVMALKDAMN